VRDGLSSPARRAAFCPLAALALAALAGCPKAAPPPPQAPPAAATVDGAPIPISVLQREVDRLRGLELREPGQGRLQEASAVPPGPAAPLAAGSSTAAEAASTPASALSTQQLARALLGPLIDQKLLAARARALGLQVSDADVQRAFDKLADEAKAAGSPLQERLARAGVSDEELQAATRERLLAERAMAHDLRELSLDKDKPTPQELRDYEAQHREVREVPEQVRAQHLFVATPEKAKGLLDQLRRGASFEVLARESGESPDAKNGGDLGFISRGLLPPPVDEALWQLHPGQLSGVVRSAYGYHLVKALERRPGRRKSDAEVKELFERRLLLEKRAGGERQILEGLRRKATITLDEAALSQIR
jgi:peptidyl-prolyl cis-trans isomerase C